MATEMTTQNPAADVLRDSLNQQLFFEIEEDSELEPSQRKINDGGRIANDALWVIESIDSIYLFCFNFDNFWV